MDTHHDYDVVVVGARCAGAATAMPLARSGLRVALVDRAPEGSDTLSAPARLRARMTVGADGLHSTIAKAVGAIVERRGTGASAFIYAHVSGLETDGYEWFYGPGITAGLIPTNFGQTCAWVGLPSARFRADIA